MPKSVMSSLKVLLFIVSMYFVVCLMQTWLYLFNHPDFPGSAGLGIIGLLVSTICLPVPVFRFARWTFSGSGKTATPAN